MVPFDRTALLVMLLTFYPEVSRANLERAYQERPEYFAGGRLFGSNGEKLLLADGRAFDLAYDAWGPRRRWQVLDVTGAGPGEFNPFPLEEGLLVPFNVDAPTPAPPGELAIPLRSHVAEAAGQLGVEQQLLATRAGALAEAAAPEQLADIAGDELGALLGELDTEEAGWSAFDPAPVIERTANALPGIEGQVDAHPDPRVETEDLPDPGPVREDRDEDDRPGREGREG